MIGLRSSFGPASLVRLSNPCRDARVKCVLLLASVALAVATPASAAVDCNQAYKDFMQGFTTGPMVPLTGDEIAMVIRTSLRGFDSCTSGDARFTGDAFWKEITNQSAAKDFAADFWRSQAANGPAK